MTTPCLRRGFAGALLVGLSAAPWAATAAEPGPPLRVELNRLEPVAGGCRVYLVVANGRGAALRSLKLDLVLFGQDGVIDRRLAVEAGPLHGQKTSVKLFDVAGYACPDLGSVLVNDVLACEGEAGPEAGCLGRLELASRAPVALTR